MKKHEILARLKEIDTEFRALNAAHPDVVLPAEAQAQWDRLDTEQRGLKSLQQRQALIDELDRTAPADCVGGGAPAQPEIRVAGFDAPAQTPESFDGLFLRTQEGQTLPILESRHTLASFLPASESRAQELGLGGYLRSLYRGPQTELERRVMSESSIGSGGALVPVPVAAGILDELRANTVSFRAGCRTVPMSSQSLTFGLLTKTPVGAWRAELGQTAEDDALFKQAKMIVKAWALRIKISRELLEDGTNVDSIVRSAFAASGALALDQAILSGDGTANSPLGIMNTPGIQTIALGGKLSNWDPVLDGALDLENVNAGKVSAMIMAPRTNRAIRGFKDANGNPLSAPADVASIPRLTTTSVPVDQGTDKNASTIVMGDFSNVYVGMRTSLQISVLNELYAETGEVGFMAWMRADVLVVRPQTLLTLTGITA